MIQHTCLQVDEIRLDTTVRSLPFAVRLRISLQYLLEQLHSSRKQFHHDHLRDTYDEQNSHYSLLLEGDVLVKGGGVLYLLESSIITGVWVFQRALLFSYTTA